MKLAHSIFILPLFLFSLLASADVSTPTGTKPVYNSQDFGRNGIYKVGDIYLGSADGTHTMRLAAPSTLSGDSFSFILPGSNGTSGQVLSTNGSGTLSWITSIPSGTANATAVFDGSGVLTSSFIIADSAGGMSVDSDSHELRDLDGHRSANYDTRDLLTAARNVSANWENGSYNQPANGLTVLDAAGGQLFQSDGVSVSIDIFNRSLGTILNWSNTGIGIGTSTPSAFLDVVGDGSTASANINQVSSATGLNVQMTGSGPGILVDTGGATGPGLKASENWTDTNPLLTFHRNPPSGPTGLDVSFSLPQTTGTTSYVLPGADGTSGQALTTDGSGIMSWATFVGRTSTDTLTNKSISGSNNTITAVPLTTAVTGILPTANGGTGVNSTTVFPSSGTIPFYTVTPTLNGLTYFSNVNGTQSSSGIKITSGSIMTIPIGGTLAIKPLNHGEVLISTPTSGNIDESVTTAAEVAELSGITSAVVGINDVQTLTNKTLTSPVINTAALTLATTGGTPSTLDYYEEFSGTVTLTDGAGFSQTGTAKIIRIGRLVTAEFPTMIGSSSSTNDLSLTFSNSGSNIPTRFAPTTSRAHVGSYEVFNNTAAVTGTVSISSSVITFTVGVSGGASTFTASGTKGILPNVVTWQNY